MSVLRYYVCITLYSDPCGPWLVISDLYLILSLVLCCDIHHSTLTSIMYPACMITVHDRKSRVLQRPRPTANTRKGPQARSTVGRTIHSLRSNRRRGMQTEESKDRRRRGKPVECGKPTP